MLRVRFDKIRVLSVFCSIEEHMSNVPSYYPKIKASENEKVFSSVKNFDISAPR